jgi:hypothetical protein
MNFNILTIPEFEQLNHEAKRSKYSAHSFQYLPIERYNLTKKKIVKVRKTELKTNHLDLPVNEILQHKVTKDAFNTNRFTDLIIDYLKLIHNCNSARRISSEGRYRKGIGYIKGLNKGMEDIQAIINGRLIAIEVKSPTDRISPDQLKRKAALEADGGVYIIAESFEGVQEDLMSCSIIPNK